MTKREELARGAAESVGLEWESLPEGPKWGYAFHRGTFYDTVDAILEALMEPSEGMLQAGFDKSVVFGSEFKRVESMWQSILKHIKEES